MPLHWGVLGWLQSFDNFFTGLIQTTDPTRSDYAVDVEKDTSLIDLPRQGPSYRL